MSEEEKYRAKVGLIILEQKYRAMVRNWTVVAICCVALGVLGIVQMVVIHKLGTELHECLLK